MDNWGQGADTHTFVFYITVFMKLIVFAVCEHMQYMQICLPNYRSSGVLGYFGFSYIISF